MIRHLPLLLVGLLALLLTACSSRPAANLVAAIETVSPASGSFATELQIVGEGFTPGSTVEVCGFPLDRLELQAGEVPVVAGPHVGGKASSASRATGTLAGLASYGPCDVVVRAPNGQVTRLEGAFQHVRAEVPSHSLLVRVLTASGVPAEGATVVARPAAATDPSPLLASAAGKATSEADGDDLHCGKADGGGYARCDLPEGDWDIFASFEEKWGMVGSARMTTSGGDAGDIRLDDAASLSITIRGESGRAAGARVSLGTAWEATANGRGVASIGEIPAGTFRLRVEHDSYLPASRNVTFEPGEALELRVKLTHVQRAPVFSTAPVERVLEDQGYRYLIRVTDDDGDPITITAPVLPTWLSLIDEGEGAAALTGTPADSEIGVHEVVLRASDGERTSEQSFRVEVVLVNDAPVITSAPIETATEDEAYSYEIDTTDPDGDRIFLSAPGLPAWLSLHDGGDGTALLSGTPTNDEVGAHSVTIQASDGLELARQEFTLTVVNVNDAPAITSAPLLAATQDQPYSYRITVSDVDADDSLTITAPKLPHWLSLEDEGDGAAVLSGTPGNDEVGSHQVELRVSDGLEADVQEFTIVVENVNDSPVITSEAVVSATQDERYLYTISALDADGDALTISAPSLPGWLSLQDVTSGAASLAGTPDYSMVGDHRVTIEVTDGEAISEQSFVITVANVDDPPEILAFSAPPSIWVEIEAVFGLSVRDLDGDELVCTFDPGDGSGVRTLPSCDEARHVYTSTGTYDAVVVATAAGVERSRSVLVDLDPPVFPYGCDDCGVAVPFHPDFSFAFYGVAYDAAYVNSNGLIAFGGSTSEYAYSGRGSMPSLPSIALFWSDLAVTDPNQVRFEALPDRLVIVYDRIRHLYDGAQEFSAVASLFEDGRIEVSYGSLGDVANDAYVIGVFDGSQTSNTFLSDATASLYGYLDHGSGLILHEEALFDAWENADIRGFSHRTITYYPRLP